MPELPEVETVRRTLEPLVLNLPIVDVEVLYPRILQNVDVGEFQRSLVGSSFESLERRGKYLLFGLSSKRCMVVHLRMTGRLIAASNGDVPLEKHTAFVFRFSDSSELRFSDQRKFATIHLLTWDNLDEIRGLRELGPEPLEDEFTPGLLGEILAGRKAPIKSILLDQRRIAGLGNIYADEALFVAQIHPARPGGDLSWVEIEKLHSAIRAVLIDAVENQGTTFRDYRTGTGTEGSFQNKLQVYGRKGEPCPRCGETLLHQRIGGRTSVFCPVCQGDGSS